MSRRRRATKREKVGDNRFHDPVVQRLINMCMRRGKKSVAERVVYGAFDRLHEKNQQTDPVEMLRKALDNVKPRLEVKSRRVGGANYQVPVEVAPDRQLAVAMRWMIDLADTRKGMPMSQALAQEISDAAAGQGNAVKKRDDTHKMAQANRAFAHLRW
jgi:small subunit ribosomal protein S7